MSKVRINDLARELEVKSKAILDALVAVGVTEKKTHSSSIEVDEAEKVRQHLASGSRPGTSARSAAENKPKQIEEFAGRVNSGHAGVLARSSPP